MSNESGSGAPGTTGGDPANQNQLPTNVEPPKPEAPTGQPKTVSRDDHQRAINDMHKFKTRATEVERELEELKAEKLKESNDYKSLYELEKTGRKTAESKLGETNEAFVKTQKYNAVRLEAIKKGLINTEDLSLVNLDDVKVEVIDGEHGTRFEVRGVDTFVDSLQSSRPHWFKSTTPPNIDSRTGGKPSIKGKLTAADVWNAEKQAKIGKMTTSEYHDIHKRFTLQQREASA